MNEEGPIIKLPSDERLSGALRRKLDEYKLRVELEDREGWVFRAPETRSHGSRYKAFVLERLLAHGEVRTYELSRELGQRDGYVAAKDFNTAAGVIDSYCRDGGRNLTGGTGLAI